MNAFVESVGPLGAVTTTRRPGGASWLQRFGAAVWRSLEAVGHRRAARELSQLADRWTLFDPALAASLREACRDEHRRADTLLVGEQA